MKVEFTVEAGAGGQRIDLFVGEKLGLSRARIKDLFEEGRVRVDGRRTAKGQTVQPGQKIDVELPESSAALEPDGALPLMVLYEDADVVVVDKPARVPCHPLKPGERGTVANALVARYPEMLSLGDDPREAGLCHRLDIETSGILVAAKNRASWEALRQAFSSTAREIDKRYVAIVSGPLAEQGEIELPLVHRGDHVRPTFEAEGRPARTEFTVRKRRGEFALVDLSLITGVLHQIRAHLAAVGSPIVGDALYGGRAEPELELTGALLHAASIRFEHPSTREPISVESPMPPHFRAAYRRFFGEDAPHDEAA
jgi:23S rRNA pseudouridine1911/1915/1917 synthase